MMLRLDHLRKCFGTTVAVQDVSLDVRAGEVLGLLGPNGAGKSTTIAMAVGLLSPDSGTVTVDGVGPPTSPAVRAKIGVAPQTLAVYDQLTGEENLRFFAKLYGITGERGAQRVAELLDLVGLTERGGHAAGTYSGGMKRRLNLAAAMVHSPPLVLLDEPTAGVDPQSRNAIFDIVAAMRARGTTVVYTTHYMEEAQRLCDRVAIIDHGRVLAVDTVDALIEAHGGESVVTVTSARGAAGADERRTATADPVGELHRLFTGPDSAGVVSVRVDRPTLESVFLNLTGKSLRD